METLIETEKVSAYIDKIADKIADRYRNAENEVALIGIRARGEVLADRLQKRLEDLLGRSLELGTLDITMYRDDLNQAGSQSLQLGTTEIPFDIDGKEILLVDDVLNTGRSVRAGLDALVALGRPKAIRLAVLIDRGAREFPISADFIGMTVENVPEDVKVQVWLEEFDGKEAVVLIDKE